VLRLLDVNILIALGDEEHSKHGAAWNWFDSCASEGWATCPLTENGFLRIISHPAYPRCPGPPAKVLPLLRALRGSVGHAFWPDDISLADATLFSIPMAGLGSKQLTDIYLLGLARRHGAKFSTFDGRIPTDCVQGGIDALEVVP